MLGKKATTDSNSIAEQLAEMKTKEAELTKQLETQKIKEEKEREQQRKIDLEIKHELENLKNEKAKQAELEDEAKKVKEVQELKEKRAREQDDLVKAKAQKISDLQKLKPADVEEHREQEHLKQETDKAKQLQKRQQEIIKEQTKKENPPKEKKPIKIPIKMPKISFNFGFKSKKKTDKPKEQKEPKPEQKSEAIDTKIHPSKYTDIAVLGLRLAIGFAFIAHGLSKMDGTDFANMLASMSIPIELAYPIAYAELLAGVFIVLGFLTRISSAMIGVIMLGAIFVVKGASALIGQGGVELDVIILAAVAVLGMFGPGKFSVANIAIKGRIFTRFLQ